MVVLNCNQGNAQLNNLANVWYFGNNVSLDFSNSTLTVGTGPVDTQEGVATISDQVGNLLFFTDGMQVWDATNTTMPQGFGLFGDWSSSQAAIIVPSPMSSSQFYIFTTQSIDGYNNPILSYSLVDMSLPGNGTIGAPLGDIVLSEKNIFLASPVVEKLSAVRKCDNSGYWILSHSKNSNNFLAFELTSSGLNTTPIISSVGITHNITGTSNELNGVGYMKFSRDGSKIALVYRDVDNLTTAGAGAYLYDFDNSTGAVFNESHVPGSENIPSLYGLEFSPDGNQLYIGGTTMMYRADLSLGTPITSVTMTSSLSSNTVCRALQVGPDDNMYVSINNLGTLGRITNPNSLTATFDPTAVNLITGTNGRFGLPNAIPSLFQSLSGLDLGNDTSFCDVVSTTIDAGGPYDTYLWSNGATTQSTQINQPGQYWVEVSENGCIASDTITLELQFSPVIDLGNDTTVCDLPLTLNAGTSATSYLWNNGATTQSITANLPGTYTVIGQNGLCSDTASIDITLFDVALDLGPDTTVCGNSQGVLLDPGVSNVNYLWSDGSTGSTLLVNTSQQYFLTISNNSCSATDTINVEFGTIEASFTYQDETGCLPLNFDFFDQSTSSSSIVSWDWDFGNNSGSTLQNPSAVYNSNGTFDVSLSVTDLAGCTDDTTIQVDVIGSASAISNFVFNPLQISSQETVYFNNLSENATSWYWEFGDGANSTDENPTHLYQTGGEYEIMLVAINAAGCNDTLYLQVTIRDDILFFAPNSFSPDGDEHNNVWAFSVVNIDGYDFKIEIYNRWGERIWESYNASAFWDGVYKGRLVQDGTYTWKAVFSPTEDGDRIEYVGHVNVLR